MEQSFKTKSWVDQISERVTARIVIDRFNLKDRGLLDYERCTMAELETFIKARRLNLPSEDTCHIPDPTNTIELRNTRDRPHRSQERAKRLEATRAKAKKAAYIKVLHEADEAIVFDKFFELPPDLRTMVYKEYSDDLSRLPTTLPELPYQPPLTLASSDLRKEALPSFYERATFVLRLNVRTRAELHVSSSVVSLHNTAADPDLLTSANLAPTALSRISRFRLRLYHFHTYLSPGSGRHREAQEYLNWDINLDGVEGSVVSGYAVAGYLAARPYWIARRERLELAISRVQQDIAARPKAHRLRRSDLADLQEVVREALNPPANA